MLDGRQVAVISHAIDGDTDSALALLAGTTPGEPWENAVTACLTIQCRGASGCVDLTSLVDQYHGLDTSTPGLAVFHTRLGLSFVDAIGAVDTPLAPSASTRCPYAAFVPSTMRSIAGRNRLSDQ